MSSLNPKQEARVEGIAKNCLRFLRIHAQEAILINPALEPAAESMIFRKMSALRKALSNKINFGGQAFLFADILISDDEDKKRVLLDPKDERSLFFQIVASDDMDQAPDKKSHIYDLHTYFARLDPKLGMFAELVIHWAWWDLPDAVDLFVFDQAAQRFEALRSSQLSEQVIQVYRRTLNIPPAQEVTRGDILRHEADNCKKIVERWALRCATEPAHQSLLAFEQTEDLEQEDVDKIILDLATHLTGIRRVKESPEMNPNAQVYYADKLHKTVKETTLDDIIQYETEMVQRLKSDLYTSLGERHGSIGTPFNYKSRLLAQLTERYDKLEASIG